MDQKLKWSVAAAFATGVFVSLTLQVLHSQSTSQRQKSKFKQKEAVAQAHSLLKPTEPSLDVLNIRQGIEGCIGNTPLIRIKSLSEETGCEILAKAEFLNGAGNSPKDRVASSIISMVDLFLYLV